MIINIGNNESNVKVNDKNKPDEFTQWKELLISDLNLNKLFFTVYDYDKLKSDFIKAATEIRLAIFQNRPIIVRHHNDADGYSSGFALERAIIPLVSKQHGGGKSPWESCPSKEPSAKRHGPVRSRSRENPL
jgi:RecJ-like exonuclease